MKFRFDQMMWGGFLGICWTVLSYIFHPTKLRLFFSKAFTPSFLYLFIMLPEFPPHFSSRVHGPKSTSPTRRLHFMNNADTRKCAFVAWISIFLHDWIWNKKMWLKCSWEIGVHRALGPVKLMASAVNFAGCSSIHISKMHYPWRHVASSSGNWNLL